MRVAGRGDRRALDSEARRHATSATARGAVRRAGRRAAARPRAAAPSAGDDLALLRGARRRVRSARSARCGGAAFRESALFTHRGLSGPAILQASSYWRPGEAVEMDLLPGEDAAALLTETRERGRGLVRLLEERLPRRFAQAFAEHFAPPPAGRAAQARARGAGPPPARLAARAERHRRLREGRGHRRRRRHARALLAHARGREVPGLYFIGEVVDVTGWLGGFNFQWAWASGFAAGQAA